MNDYNDKFEVDINSIEKLKSGWQEIFLRSLLWNKIEELNMDRNLY